MRVQETNDAIQFCYDQINQGRREMIKALLHYRYLFRHNQYGAIRYVVCDMIRIKIFSMICYDRIQLLHYCASHPERIKMVRHIKPHYNAERRIEKETEFILQDWYLRCKRVCIIILRFGKARFGDRLLARAFCMWIWKWRNYPTLN